MATAQRTDPSDAPATQAPPPAAPRAGLERLRRRPDRGLLGGVGAGAAEHFRVDVRGVRVVMALMLAAGGLGVVIYALAWALIPVAEESVGVARPRGAWREAVAIVVIVGGALIALRRAGLLIGDSLLLPLVLGTCGLALVWRPAVSRAAPAADAGAARRLIRGPWEIDLPRLLIGVLLVAVTSATLLHALGVPGNLGKAFGAVAIVATMLGLLFVPFIVRLGRSLTFERTARIREQERAELAAHLHDSVLQTLALIQKRAGDPREVAGLARRQERELRHWLHERPARSSGETVAVAFERAAAEVEQLHGVAIEVVVVGDRPLDGALEALVHAAREAMTNASKFAGTERIDLYVEASAERVEVYVRDRGAGFDLQAVPPDRRGVRDSIIGRVERHDGRAAVHSSPGAGTEVELVMECRAA